MRKFVLSTIVWAGMWGAAAAFSPRVPFFASTAHDPIKATLVPEVKNEAPPASVTSSPTVAAVPKVAQRWKKSTKQVATLGPASSTFEMIEKLFLAGVDMFRLNFSHGSQEQKKELLIIIRQIEEKYSHPIAILGDLQGPKLRVCVFLVFAGRNVQPIDQPTNQPTF